MCLCKTNAEPLTFFSPPFPQLGSVFLNCLQEIPSKFFLPHPIPKKKKRKKKKRGTNKCALVAGSSVSAMWKEKEKNSIKKNKTKIKPPIILMEVN